MTYITRTQVQTKELNDQKLFLESKFGFEVYAPQFEKLPHASPLFKNKETSRLISDIEQFLLTNIIIDVKSINIDNLQSKCSDSDHKTYTMLTKNSIFRENKISVPLICATLVCDHYINYLSVDDKNIDFQLSRYNILSLEEKVKLSRAIGNKCNQFLETLYNMN